MANDIKNMKNIETFLEGLTKLSRETGIVVGGCGCCDSPFLAEEDAAGLERGVYRRNEKRCRPELEFFGTKNEDARAWCVARGFKFNMLSGYGSLSYTDAQGVDQHTKDNFDFPAGEESEPCQAL